MDKPVELKRVGTLAVDDDEKGDVSSIVATLGVVDREKDVILPDVVIEGGTSVLSSYDHDVPLAGAPPVGKGGFHIVAGQLVFKGHYFMSTQRGLEAFRTTKELGEDGEWSFGFIVTKTAKMTPEWAAKGAKRLIAGLRVKEASPVFMGAGLGTRTLSVKCADCRAKEQADGAGCGCGGKGAQHEEPPVEPTAEEKAAAEAEAKRLADEALEVKRREDEALQAATAREVERFQKTFRWLGVA